MYVVIDAINFITEIKMIYPRPIESIHQIEITSRCNLKCPYCLQAIMTRKREDMTDGIFEKSVHAAKKLVDNRTQHEIWLHGLGESLLHPNFLDYCEHAKKELPNIQVRISTNAILLTESMIDRLKEIGIILHVSLQRPDLANRKAIHYSQKKRVLENIGVNPIHQANDWAQQMPDEVCILDKAGCGWLHSGWAMVLANGELAQCCTDGLGLYTIGHIDSWEESEVKPFKLCETCNLTS